MNTRNQRDDDPLLVSSPRDLPLSTHTPSHLIMDRSALRHLRCGCIARARNQQLNHTIETPVIWIGNLNVCAEDRRPRHRVDYRPAVDGDDQPIGTRPEFGRTPLPASELKTAVTTRCSDTGSPVVVAMSLIG